MAGCEKAHARAREPQSLEAMFTDRRGAAIAATTCAEMTPLAAPHSRGRYEQDASGNERAAAQDDGARVRHTERGCSYTLM
jgi:hypothetical protein